MKVTIIGGGIIGCLTAWRLAQRGIKVVILERGYIGRESSWAGAGILCPIHPWLYPDAFTHLVDASLAMYPRLQQELESCTGISAQWRRCGLMIPFFCDDAIHHRADALAWSARFDWQVECLDAVATKELEPVLADDVEGALLWPEVGQVRNPRLLKAVYQALQHEGVEMHEHTAVESLLGSAGHISGVLLADGETLAADAVLLAAGSWSRELALSVGFDMAVKPVKGQIVLLKDQPGRIPHIIKHDRVYFVPREDGHILIGASMEHVGFKQGNTVSAVHQLLDAAIRIAPGLKNMEIARQWQGFRPGSPDGLPFIGEVKNTQGLWVATGHYRNGVALAPITAEIISRGICGETPLSGMDSFLPDRDIVPSHTLGYPDDTVQG